MVSDTTKHYPVLLSELISIITPQHGGTFIDCTFGQGGYSKKILEFSNTNVIALDRDINSEKIANSFDNGIEFFSTFGGSTLSCAIAKEVIEIVDQEGLQSNAQEMGIKLKKGLINLQEKYQSIGDVRGMGLFVGIEFIDKTGKENSRLCTFVKNRMREYRILVGSEGPKDNVLKVRPPLSIESDDIDMIIETLDIILAEVDL